MLRILIALGAAAALSTANAAEDKTPGRVFKDCPACPEMVVIPPGSITKGSENLDVAEPVRYEGPAHKVTIGYAFAVAKTEATTGQFKEFADGTGYVTSDTCNISYGKGPIATPKTGWRNPGYGRPPAENEPGVCLSWNDAKAYIAWLNNKSGKTYRLLSESEWEYVARAGKDGGRYTWGNNPDDACKTANVADKSQKNVPPPMKPRLSPPANCDDGYSFIAPAGALPPNAFGVHDMIGSTWEWVEDCYVMPYPANSPKDGKPYLGPNGCDRRVSKGGSWGSTIDRQNPTFRGRDPASLVSQIFGFRVARDLD